MNRLSRSKRQLALRVPRASGDEPVYGDKTESTVACSPR